VETVEAKMKWLVLGSTGQLGQSFCEALTARNEDFVGLSHKQGDISSRNFVDDYFSAVRPEIIVNLAAWTDVDGAESDSAQADVINGAAVGFLAEASKRLGSTFVHVSSDYVFSGVGTNPWREHDVKNPISAYGRSKAIGEDNLLRLYPEKSYIFRTAWLYSKFGVNFTKSMIRLSLKNLDPIKVVSDQIGQPTSAKDLVNQILRSVESRIPFGTYHATNTGQTSWYGFAREILKNCNLDEDRVLEIKSDEYPRVAKRPAFSVLGQDAWAKTPLEPMRNWKTALGESLPEILAAVRAEV
jgi:dTDP-4-dehydrorhamnose reductase